MAYDKKLGCADTCWFRDLFVDSLRGWSSGTSVIGAGVANNWTLDLARGWESERVLTLQRISLLIQKIKWKH